MTGAVAFSDNGARRATGAVGNGARTATCYKRRMHVEVLTGTGPAQRDTQTGRELLRLDMPERHLPVR